ncbi:2-nitropropane dioxygenase family protein 5 [Achromobacter xylosoxidans A8]|uniref:2-nitropropane dioxygenase family protein 5 n=1 Tax=Achromobacter xylosoxidans (strain A8) TaxID=762376 RepID=E3HQ38_ACHXA|nr:nitronate monooxygenase family protein [Achromobacter xylosoxidans]ADP17196.1 2-nitropropane dioxygenase family protein 5 [Achromobacter xylosoxidans A8]
MTKLSVLRNLRLPVVASPMFIASGVDLVLAQCQAGIVGSFPALNARGPGELDAWISRIETALVAHDSVHPSAPAAPYAVNIILHHSNDRQHADLETCVRRRVPIVITSVGDPKDVVRAVHGYGGVVLHDVINQRHARKAAAAGVDGLILVCAGAGGHGGNLSPFALVGEVRRWFDGLLLVAGAISTGEHVLAVRAMGADLAYVGTRFLASPEASIEPAYKQAVLEAGTDGVIYSDLFSWVHANYLKQSIADLGLDTDRLPTRDSYRETLAAQGEPRRKLWRDIWSAGQGVGCIDAIVPTRDIVASMRLEYEAARARLSGVAADAGISV